MTIPISQIIEFMATDKSNNWSEEIESLEQFKAELYDAQVQLAARTVVENMLLDKERVNTMIYDAYKMRNEAAGPARTDSPSKAFADGVRVGLNIAGFAT